MKTLLAPVLAFPLALLLAGAPLLAPAQPLKTEQTTTELLAHAPDGVAPGKPLWLGLSIRHARHWHTYWRNPGDSGLPTQLNWTLPAGVQAGAIQWPAPHKLPLGPLVNYGYEGDLLLPVAVTLPSSLPAGPVQVALSATWLVCKEVCIPEQGEFKLTLPREQALVESAARFEAALAAEPKPLNTAVQAQAEGLALVLQVAGLPAAWRGQAVSYFAVDAGVIDHAQPETAQWDGELLRLRVPLSVQRSESPASLAAVLVGGGAGTPSVALNFGLTGGWDAADAAARSAAQSPAPDTAHTPVTPVATPLPNPGGASASLVLALLLAFVGGVLLNLMPCVFPVLSLKALGLVNEAPHERRVGALAYTVGVVGSFVLLAALLLGLRAGGNEIGWGFQLQQPGVVVGLALLFTVIALNLFGVFEFGTWVPSGAAAWRAQRPWVDQLATGVLSVAVASPCTAPFMGAALGAAIALPTVQGLAVFAVLGLGLAAPYALVALWPPLARRLPRPGAWMARLRTLLAFPMLATVLWLTWVLGVQLGLSAAMALAVLLLALSLAVWAWGQGGAWRGLGLVALAAGLAWSLPTLRADPPGRDLQRSTDGDITRTRASASTDWQVWTPAVQADALASGRPVFVDFTAAWCISCQFNKRGVLADAAVLADFEARKVLRLRADWTLRDAVISEELRRLGRSGVPVYALYAPGQTTPSPTPTLLPEILSASGVREALAALPPPL